VSCYCVRLEFGNPEEGEHPPLEAATDQQLGKTEKTLYVLWLQSLECVSRTVIITCSHRSVRVQ
jgi:hypothetical protein